MISLVGLFPFDSPMAPPFNEWFDSYNDVVWLDAMIVGLTIGAVVIFALWFFTGGAEASLSRASQSRRERSIKRMYESDDDDPWRKYRP